MPSAWVGVRVEGLNSVIRGLIALGVDVEDLKDAFGDIADMGVRISQPRAPVVTGALRRNIRGSHARNKAVVRVGGASVPYAGPIQFGWRARNIAPASFLDPIDTELSPMVPRLIGTNVGIAARKRGFRVS